MVTADDIRSAIGNYLAGDFSFDSFENWMIANTRGIHNWGDSQTKYLAYSVDLQVSEYLVSENGQITETTLRDELQSLANTFLSVQNFIVVSGTSTNSVAPLGLKTLPVDRLFVGAFESLVPR